MIFTLGYLVMVLIRPQEYVSAFQGYPLMPVLLLLAGGWWLVTRKSFDTPHFTLVILFLLFTAFSRAVNGWVGGTYDWLVEFGPICLMFYLVAAASRSTANVRIFMATITICAVVMTIHGADQLRNGIGWTGALPIQGRITYLGMFNDPNDLGAFFVVALPMALFLASGRGLFRKLFWTGCIGVLLYGVLLTDSRGTMLATAAILGLMVLRRYGVMVAGLATVPVLLLLTMLPSRLQDLDASEASAFGRVESWYVGLQLFKSNPLFGVGADRFTAYHELTAHNSYVLALAESGIIGYMLFLGLLGYGVLMMQRLGTAVPSGAEPGAGNQDAETYVRMGRTLFYSLVGFCVSIFFLSRTYNVVLYVLLGLISGLYLAARPQLAQLPAFRLSSGWLMLGAISVASAAGLFVVVRLLLIVAG